jgi:TonB family protein
VLQLFPRRSVEEHRVKTRWGWLFVSLGLMAMAGYFLYPSVVSLTERENSPPPAPETRATAELPVATPIPSKRAVSPPSPQPVRRARVDKPAPTKTIAAKPAPPIPIRQVAPSVPDGIRNRIYGEIPIDVIIQVGKTGRVERAEAARGGDGVRSYLAKQAVQAVKQWKFQPATVARKPVSVKWIVSFRFRNSWNGTNWMLRPTS